MTRVWIMTALLGVSLAASWATWVRQGDAPTPDGEVVVLDLAPGDLASVAWTDPRFELVITPQTDKRGTWYAVDRTPLEGTDDEPAQSVRFTANESAEQLWEVLAELPALREVEPEGVTDAQLGFAPPEGELILTRAGGEQLIVAIGGHPYRNLDRYIRYGDRTFVVDKDLLKPLELHTSQLMERRLLPLEPADIETVGLQTSGGTRTLVHGNRFDPQAAFWAGKDDPDTPDPDIQGWMDTLLRIQVQDYVTELPEGSTRVLAYAARGKGQTWQVELFEGGDGQLYGRSELTRGFVRLVESMARDVVDEVETAVGG